MGETGGRFSHEWNGETVDLAYRQAHAGREGAPCFVWLGGFRSDMEGTKAQTVVAEAEALSCASLRFDYSGHGQSGGAFADGTISRWVDESRAIIEALAEGPVILVGSSMGAWIALRVAQEWNLAGRGDRLKALLLIAPAPDFTSTLMEPRFTDAQWKALADDGRIEEPSAYSDEPDVITRSLIEDGRNNLVLTGDLVVDAPIRILQGTADPDVPWEHAMRLMESLPHDDVTLTLVKNGDHRLSEDRDLALLKRTMSSLVSG